MSVSRILFLMTTITPLKSEELSQTRINPQKRNILIQRLARAPWWLLILLGLILIFAITVADSTLYHRAWEQVSKGIWTTIWVTLVAYSIALVIGLIIALLRTPSKSVIYNLLVYQPVTAYMELIRGIPTLVLVLYIVLALFPEVLKLVNQLGVSLLDNDFNPFGISDEMSVLKARDIPTVWRAIIALAISYSAFMSEIFRAGIESVELGQREAARSLGMTRWQVMRLIVLPQAIRNVLPPLGNDFIALLKESSLVSIVGVEDIARQASNFRAATFTVFPAYNLIALTYLTLTLSLSMVVKSMEWYLGRSRKTEH